MAKFSEEEQTTLRKCVLLGQLSEDNFKLFLHMSERLVYESDKIVLEEGQESEDLFIIVSGEVELYKQSESTTKKQPYVLATLVSGNSIGELRVLQNRPCSLTIKTSKPTVLLCIAISELHTMGSPTFYESIRIALEGILISRLLNSNDSILGEVAEKHRKRKQFLFFAGISLVLLGLLLESGLALYYLKYPSNLCSQTEAAPSIEYSGKW